MAFSVVSAMTADPTPVDADWSLTVPTHTTGDVLLVAISSNLDGSATMTLQESATWTQIDYINDFSANSLLIYLKIATSGAETVTIDQSTAAEKIGGVAVLSGLDTADLINQAWAYSANADTAPTHAGLTPDEDSVAIAIFGQDDGSDNIQGGANNGTASGWTTIFEDGQGGSSGTYSDPSSGGAGVGMAYKEIADTVPSGAHEWLLDGTETWYAGTIVFKKAADAGASPKFLTLLGVG